MKKYKGKCPICGSSIIEADNVPIGYVKQGYLKQYFHLSCLESIGRGYNGKAEEKKIRL